MALVTPPYHFGLVVADIDAAMDELGRALGLTWAKMQRKTHRMETSDGPNHFDVAYVYALQGPPYLELIEQREGSVFSEVGLHHIGVWCDDPAQESARLDAEGVVRETVILTPEGNWSGGLFHLSQCDLRIELVDIAKSGPRLCRYLEGGDYA